MSQPPIDMSQMVKQAQELQQRMRRIQEDLKHRTAEATVGGGMVQATVNGHLELVRLEIDPLAVDPRDVQMLQDLIIAAVGQAMKRAQAMVQGEMQKATGVPLGSFPFGGAPGQ